MRRLLLILMIALLPVRGWTSDVMSVAHATQQLITTELVATHALQTRATATFNGYFEVKPASSMPWDCPMAAKDGGGNLPTSAKPPMPVKPLCHGCGTCQLCMAFATGVSPMVVEATRTQYAVPLLRNSGFSSATLPPGFKPPIA